MRRYYLARCDEKKAKLRARYHSDEKYREAKRAYAKKWKAENRHRALSHLSHLAKSTAHLYVKRLMEKAR